MIRKALIFPFLITGILILGTITKAQNLMPNEIIKTNFKTITKFQKQGWSNQLYQQPDLPRLVKKYTNDNNSWLYIYNTNHTYDYNNNLIYSLETNVPDNTNSIKDSLIYNSQGKLTQKITNAWQDDTWVNFQRSNITYNSNGYKTLELIESYNVDTWDTTFFEEMNFENNQISQYYSFMGLMGMKIEVQIDFIYDGSNVLQEMNFSTTDFETGELVYFQKLTDLTFESYTGNYEEDKIETAEINMWNNEWVYFGRFETAYDDLGGYERLYEIYDGSAYENFQLETETYDEYLNLVESKIEIWENNSWIMDTGEKNTLEYENNNLVQRIIQTWNMDSNSYIDMNMEEYEDFLITSNSTLFNQEANFKFQVFPNPAIENVYIIIEKITLTKMRIELFDNLGRSQLKKSYSMKTNSFELDLKSLKKGSYLLKITTPFSTQTKKLIISK